MRTRSTPFGSKATVEVPRGHSLDGGTPPNMDAGVTTRIETTDQQANTDWLSVLGAGDWGVYVLRCNIVTFEV